MTDLPALIYILLIAPLAFAWWARSRVQETYARESKIETQTGCTGIQAARLLLEEEQLSGVQLEVIPGRLTDHYDPIRKVLRLSADTARTDTITAIGIVGHEVAHAIQDVRGYALMRLRMTLGEWLLTLSRVSPLVFIGGFLFGIPLLMVAAVVIVGLQVVFSLVAYPVERNASRRALELLETRHLITADETERVRRVLRAASYTYAALVAQRVASLFFWIILVGVFTEAWRMM